jgi:DNA polymerase I-like protein with 3'-5' exonuclease and polymerase domains
MNIITTTEQLTEVVEHYLTVDSFAFDVETWGPHRGDTVRNDVLWMALATEGRVDVIPMGHPNGEFTGWDKPLLLEGERRFAKGLPVRDPQDFSKNEKLWTPKFTFPPEQLRQGEVFKALRPLFFSDKLKIAHNAKFDLKSCAKYWRGDVPTAPYFDTLVASFIVDNRNRLGLGLDDCAKRELGIEVVKGIGKEVEKHSFDDVAKYAALDAQATYELYKVLDKKIKDANLTKVWKLEMSVLSVLCDMELSGASLDVKGLEELRDKVEADIDATRADAYRLAGRAFNMNSIAEKQQLLYLPKKEGGRGLRPPKSLRASLTPKGQKLASEGKELSISEYAVSNEALQVFKNQDELVETILKYQDLNKLLTTYVVPYLGGDVTRTTNGKSRVETKEALLINGKVHTDFVQYGAETGRFSSRNPNLQNIPSSGEYGKMVRNLFVAPPGYKLVVADYSQIEPRVIASFSNDPVMCNAYRNGEDIYTAIATPLGIDRKGGKVLVLSLSYGVGPDKVADSLGISLKEAKDLLTTFESRFKDVSKYKARVVRTAKAHRPTPFVSTIFGRKRYIPDLLSSDRGLFSRAERQAFNTVIQGSAADIIKLAMVRAHSCFLDEPDVNVILTVHDELVTVAPEHMAEEVAEAIRESMEGVIVPEITIPLIADVKIVDRWGDAK